MQRFIPIAQGRSDIRKNRGGDGFRLVRGERTDFRLTQNADESLAASSS